MQKIQKQEFNDFDDVRTLGKFFHPCNFANLGANKKIPWYSFTFSSSEGERKDFLH